jgi:adenylate cyclase
VRVAFMLLVIAAVAWMALRSAAAIAAPKIAVSYVGGPVISAPGGPTLLEISRMSRIAHAADCGGRARCGMCQVRIDDGADRIDPPQPAEAFRLAAMGAAANIRLACQIRPRHALSVTRLIRPETVEHDGSIDDMEATGVATELALLQVTLRDFDRLFAERPAYDVVYLLNDLHSCVEAAVIANEGFIERSHGSQLLAVFGRKRGVEEGVRQAVRAAGAIDVALDRLNEKMAAEIGHRIECSLAIHAGPLLLGGIGSTAGGRLSVLGPTVETAQTLNRAGGGAQLIISAAAISIGGLSPGTPSEITSAPVAIESAFETIQLPRAREFAATSIPTAEG